MAPTTSTEEKPNTPVDGDLSLKQLLARPNCLRNKGGDDTADERTAARPGEVINGSSQDDVLPDAAAPLKNATIRELLDLPRLDERLAAESKKSLEQMTMPRHDPSDSSLMTQFKLHLAYAFMKMAKTASAGTEGDSN
ncbi:unnamed protein product [Heligmosomoides polygyrus]|uniref:Uncharacterized protein n=1 Tax=Heligmosomoides polygyrus TaxID=6339 RepID=A0A183FB04_HELPZ|nr:unnamed protein product [Heligmosomoides polygyrus]